MSKERLKKCEECPFYSENRKKRGYTTLRLDAHCTNCGCTLSAKTRCLSCECPLEGSEKKWFPVTSHEEQEKIKSEINGSEKNINRSSIGSDSIPSS